MINFFRKTRKKLADDNRPLKYMRYAIGEIVLVVVGILIALYLNDLKEQKNKNLLKEYYIQAIKTDLTRDQVLINEVIDSVQSQLSLLDDQINRIYDRSATIDTLIKIARYEFASGGFSITYNDNSLNSLVSTGNLNLFETGFSELLIDLEKAHREEIKLRDNLNSMYSDRLNEYHLKYTRPYNDLPEDNLIDRILWKEIDEKDFTGKFRGNLFMKRFKDRQFLKKLKVNKKKTTFLLNYIRNNFESVH